MTNQDRGQFNKELSVLVERSSSSQSVILQIEIEEARNLPRYKQDLNKSHQNGGHFVVHFLDGSIGRLTN